MPTAEQLFSEMSGAKFFTKLDCSNGYWQTAIDEESSKLIMFMAAYLGKFIPHFSDASAPLCSLIVKNSIWDFTESHKLVFQNMKKLITECPTLKIFDPKLPTKITYDASSIGLGATLEQCIDNVWYPIAFPSRTLGKSGRNYCQLKKETL